MSAGASAGLSVGFLRRIERMILWGAAALAFAAAWILLADGIGHAPSDHRLWTPYLPPTGIRGFLTTFGMWQVMMIAMMLPAVMPWILLAGALTPNPEFRAHRLAAAALFAVGYFGVWVGYSLAGAALQRAFGTTFLSAVGSSSATYFGSAALIGAGLFQFAPAKRACLKHCRNPLSFLITRWREGLGGSLRMGFHHGLYCLGCCWALMALCIVMGLMNLVWMAVLTLAICVEQVAPHGERIGQAFGIGLVGWGIWLILGMAQ